MDSSKWMNAAQQTQDKEDSSTSKIVHEKLNMLYE